MLILACVHSNLSYFIPSMVEIFKIKSFQLVMGANTLWLVKTKEVKKGGEKRVKNSEKQINNPFDPENKWR